ncbi:MAG: hypothetical protein FWG10_14430 [Eubacteriaceae bacterium]|nr:hypothetical protein [Eubacteriaceae bacterium]
MSPIELRIEILSQAFLTPATPLLASMESLYSTCLAGSWFGCKKQLGQITEVISFASEIRKRGILAQTKPAPAWRSPKDRQTATR